MEKVAMPTEYDLIVRNGLVVDGTGMPRRRVDVGVKNGKIAKLARLDDATAKEELDAAGCIVAPGIVDAHTHYDPQITFDPYATMSCFHGVTTVLAGNCGFSLAPVRLQDHGFLKGIFARVEDMHPAALDGVRWDHLETFEDFLESLEGRLGINFSCYVGHSNIRRWVMGDDAIKRVANDLEIAEMRKLLKAAMEAGAAGLSSSAAPTHMDINGRPVPSRLADRKEVLALAEEMGLFGSGSICFLPESAIGGLTEADGDLLIEIGCKSGVPVIIQGLGGRNKVDAPTATWDAAVRFLDRATERGAPVYSLLIARPFDRAFVLDESNFHYRAAFDWHEMLQTPKEERLRILRDPARRNALRFNVENYNRDASKGTTVPPPPWNQVFIDNSPSMSPQSYAGLSIQQLADAKGTAAGEYAMDLALADDFRTELRWQAESPEWRDAVEIAQRDPRMIIGTSDGGAHLARDDQADWSSYFLRSWVMDRKVWGLEEGIRQITQVPAALLGFSDRGMLRIGGWADIMIFNPDTIGPWRKEFTKDLPGGAGRFRAWGRGVHATIVNGVPIVLEGKLTGRLPGHVVRPN
jgi:N-acyl-D-aspartate/D-glutamate deacylase